MTANGTIRDGSEPINRIDEISVRRDLAYKDADEGRGTRLEADEAMLRELEQHHIAGLSCDELMAKCSTRCIIGLLYCFRKLMSYLNWTCLLTLVTISLNCNCDPPAYRSNNKTRVFFMLCCFLLLKTHRIMSREIVRKLTKTTKSRTYCTRHTS
jgi:hypothetical protein